MNVTATATSNGAVKQRRGIERRDAEHDRQLRHTRCFVGDYLRDMNVRDPAVVYELANRVLDTIDMRSHSLTSPAGARRFRREVLEKTVALCDDAVETHLGDGPSNCTVLRGATQSLLNKDASYHVNRVSRVVAPEATPRAMGPRESAAHMTIFRKDFWVRLAAPVVRLYAS